MGKGRGEGAWGASTLRPRHPPAPLRVPGREAPQTLCFVGFDGGFIMQARLIANSISTSSPLPGAGPPRGSGHSVVLPVASLSPYAVQEVPRQNKGWPRDRGNFKGLRSSVSATQGRGQIHKSRHSHHPLSILRDPDYCNFVVGFETGKCEPSNLFLFFQFVLVITCPLNLHVNFRVSA